MTWPTTKLKWIATTTAGGTPSVAEPTYWTAEDEGTPWVSIGDMSGRDLVTTTERRVTKQGIQAARLPVGAPGTLLLSMYASLGHTAFLNDAASWNQALLGIEVSPHHNLRFVKYSLDATRSRLAEFARSNTQANLNAEQVGNLVVPEPPLQEQHRIADFLDTETARIDRLTAASQRAVRLLVERRATGVAAAVAGSRHVDRRESTLAWLETVPTEWSEVRLGLLACMGSGHTPSRSHPEWWTDCTIPWITTGEVSQVRGDRVEEICETREKISELGLANSAAELHPKGTVVLCRTASAGYSGVMGLDMATSQDFVTWTCGPRLDPFYLLWCLRAMRPDLLGRLAMGSTHKTIYVPDLQMLRIPLPPLSQQKEIVSTIRCQNARVDALTDKLRRQQDLLAERRQALITAAVTGQFDVSSASGRGLTEGVPA